MTAVNTDATLYDAQEANDPGNVAVYQKLAAGTTFYSGKVTALYSQLLSLTGGGTGDTVDFMRLPEGTIIVGGWFYFETGLGGTDNDTADLGIIYEASDGTDDIDCMCNGIDIYDGASVVVGLTGALPAGFTFMLGSDTVAFPYKVTGGTGTVQLISKAGAFVTAKDMKIMLLVILPGQ